MIEFKKLAENQNLVNTVIVVLYATTLTRTVIQDCLINEIFIEAITILIQV